MKQKLLTLKALLMVLMMTLGFGQAFAEEVTYSFTISGSDFNTTSYAANNGSHESTATCTTDGTKTMTVNWTSNQVYQSSGMQWQKNNGYIYNTTDLGTIVSVTVNSSAGTFTTNYGTSEHPTSGTTVGNGFFTVKVGGATGKTSSIVVTFKVNESGPTKTSTTTTFNGESSYSVELGKTFTAPTATVTGGEGLVPTYSSSKTEVATVNAETGAVTLVGAGTTTITASYAGNETYASSSASYTLTVTKPVPVFASLEELVADETLQSGDIVKVSFSNVAIKSIYTTSQSKRTGIYFDIQKADHDIEIYYNSEEVPAGWVAGGTVSGTMECPWTYYSNGQTWELAPKANTWAWTNLTYTAPAGKETATIEATAAKTALTVGTNDVYDVTYNGDGVLSVESSNPSAATVTIEGTTVTVTPVGAGTTTITISAPATENYTAATKSYSVTVTTPATPAALPFSFDGGRSAIGNTDGMSQDGLGTDYTSAPKLKFDGTGDWLVINYAESANSLSYTIKGNSFSGGTFDVLESEDGETYTSVHSYTETELESSTAQTINDNLKAESRFVKFIYTNKSKGNVGLGNIQICTSVEANLQITDAGVATFCAPFDVDLAAEEIDATAYTATVEDGWVKLAEIESGVIKAGTAVVLKGAEMTEAKTLTGVPATTEATCTTGCLTGNLSAVTSVAIGNFLLQKQEEAGLAWYKVTEEGLKIGTNRCYLTKEAVTDARTVLNMDLNPTGIDSIATEAKTKADGKYLVNGKIVIVKAGKVYDLK